MRWIGYNDTITGHIPKGYHRDTYTLMFIAALFTIAKYENNPDALQMMNGPRKCSIYIYTHNGLLLSHKEE
jgi:hypothetical protein